MAENPSVLQPGFEPDVISVRPLTPWPYRKGLKSAGTAVQAYFMRIFPQGAARGVARPWRNPAARTESTEAR